MDVKIGELVAAVRQGDKNAFARLYELTLQSAYYLALRMLKNEQDAMDIVQDSYVEAFCSLEKLKKPESFEAWIKHITANNCRDWLKKKKGVLFSDEEQAEQVFGEIEEDDAEFLPQELLEQKGSEKMITDIIDALPEAQRMTVLLYYYNEMPVSYIARFLSCSEGTIKSRLFGARAKIKAEVEAWEKKGVKLYGMGATPMLALLLRRAIKEQRIEVELYTEAFKEINRQVDFRRLSSKTQPDTDSHNSGHNGTNKNAKTGGGQETSSSNSSSARPSESVRPKANVSHETETSPKKLASSKTSPSKRFKPGQTADSVRKGLGIISKIAAMTPQSQIILVVVSMVVVLAVVGGLLGIAHLKETRAASADVSTTETENSETVSETETDTTDLATEGSQSVGVLDLSLVDKYFSMTLRDFVGNGPLPEPTDCYSGGYYYKFSNYNGNYFFDEPVDYNGGEQIYVAEKDYLNQWRTDIDTLIGKESITISELRTLLEAKGYSLKIWQRSDEYDQEYSEVVAETQIGKYLFLFFDDGEGAVSEKTVILGTYIECPQNCGDAHVDAENTVKNLPDDKKWKSKYVAVLKDLLSDYQVDKPDELGIFDVDKNGIPEMFCVVGGSRYLLYTYKNGQVVCIDEHDRFPWLVTSKTNTAAMLCESNLYGGITVYEVTGTSLNQTCDYHFSDEEITKQIGDENSVRKNITKEEYDEFYADFIKSYRTATNIVDDAQITSSNITDYLITF